MKRFLAWMMVLLMLGQMLPGVSFAASEAEENTDNLHEVVSDPVEKPVYHTVTFTAEEEEVSTIFAADGAEISQLPEAPEIDGEDFLGWYDGDQPFTTETEIHENKSVLGVYKEKEDVEGALYANEDLYITGKVPGNGIIEVTPVRASVNGEQILCAYDISIYANKNQQKKGKTWQPADKKVKVHFRHDTFGSDKLNIYHMGADGAEYIDTVQAQDGWIEFEASSFSVYVFTQSIEKTVTINGNTYRITVSYDASARIPDGAELEVREVTGDDYLSETAMTLGWTSDDEIYYTKFLDISIVYNEKEIEPASDVEVTVELLDVEDGADTLEVVHFSDNGVAEKIENEADINGTVTFITRSFSVFGFGSVLRSLVTWTSDAVTYTLQGFSRLLNPSYTAISVAVEEGMEVLSAYNVRSTLGSLLNALYVRVSTAFSLGSRESLVVYSVKDGTVGEVLEESVSNINDSIALGSADGFAVIRDTGYRRKTFELGDVELSGMMPKEAEAEAEPAAVDSLEGEVLAAYNIHIEENGEAYQPDEEHPVNVVIAVDAPQDADLHLLHYRDDGEKEEITGFTISEGTISFTAYGFSVYAIVDSTSQSDPFSYSVKYNFLNADGTAYLWINENGESVNYQYVPTGEAPFYPGAPEPPNEALSFVGWYGKTGNDWDTEATIDVNGIGKEVGALTSSQTKNLYPRFEHVYFAYYYDETATLNGDGTVNGNVYMIDPIYEDEIETGRYRIVVDGQVKINYIPGNDSQAFIGWSTAPNQHMMSNILTETPISQDGQVIRLFPVVADVYWISFDKNDWEYKEADPADADWKYVNGKWEHVTKGTDGTHIRTGTGARYVAPMYTLQGNSLRQSGYSAIPDNTRPGYTFRGWYPNPDGSGTPLGLDYVPTQNTVYYAVWDTDPSQTYHVVFWRQVATDEVDADPKTYVYDHSETRTASTGSTVSITNADRNGAGTGFHFEEADSDISATMAADGSTVLNVKYARNIYTLSFYVSGSGYLYTGSDSSNANYGYVDGNYVELVRNSEATTRTYYTYSTGGYRIEYTDTFYIRNGNTYTATQYNGSNLPSSGTYYGLTGYDWWGRPEYSQLTRREETTYSYTWFYNGQLYTGARFTRQYSSYYHTIKTIQALYGHNILSSFPIQGDDGNDYGEYTWTDTNSIYYASNYPLKTIEVMPPANVALLGDSGGTNRLILYYIEALPGETIEATFEGMGYTLYKKVEHNFRYLTYNEEFHPIEGFDRDRSWAIPTFRSNNQASLGSAGNYDGKSYNAINRLYYRRSTNSLEFWDALTEQQIATGIQVKYQMPLTEYENQVIVSDDGTTVTYNGVSISYEGYVFAGFYEDPECKTSFNFSNKTMPNNAVKVYIGWRKLRYRIWVQPNGGILGSDSSTYFKNDWGELISEYSEVETNGRHFLEDENGTFSYVYICDATGSNPGTGDTNITEARVAYYKPTDQLTIISGTTASGVNYTYNEALHTDGKKYKIVDSDVYKFLGWYKVSGSIDENEPPAMTRDVEGVWNFSTPITENTAIRAMWQRTGHYQISYSPTMQGTNITGSIPSEVGDQNVYVDLALAVTQAAAIPPEGTNYIFMGWRTPDGNIHQPGEMFQVKADYAVPVQGQEDVYNYILTPVFEMIGTSSLTYDLNGGTEKPASLGTAVQNAQNQVTYDLNTLTVSGIVQNSAFTLSDGKGSSGKLITKPGFVLTGWNSRPDPNDEDAIHYDLGGTYGISGESNTLYAEWIPVIFDLSFRKTGEIIDEETFASSYTPINGAAFSLTGGNVNMSATSANVNGTDGVVEFIGVEPGERDQLTLTETVVPETKYRLDQTGHTVTWEIPDEPYQITTVNGQKYVRAKEGSVRIDGIVCSDAEIKNDLLSAELTLTKVNKYNHSTCLPGARFRLQNGTKNYIRGGHEDGIYVTGEQGTFTALLVDGSYTLTEILPPEGYTTGATMSWSFTVQDGEIDIADNSIAKIADGQYTFMVENEPLVAPTGYKTYILPFGILFMAGLFLGGSCFCPGRRRRKGNDS